MPSLTKKGKKMSNLTDRMACLQCKVEKSTADFYFNKTYNKFYTSCKNCHLDSQKNDDYRREWKKKYGREYYKKHKDKYAVYHARYIKDNPVAKLSCLIRASIRGSLRRESNGNSWESLVGYSRIDLVKRLESQFKDGMTWRNYGKWHIDHIKPISYFKQMEQFKDCWALDNLQPLWARDNLLKSWKYAK